MGRKKKKNRTPTESARRLQEEAICSVKDESFEADDFLDVRLVHSQQQTNGSRDSQKEPLIFLTEQDAYRIDVIHGDAVLVLSKEQQDVVSSTAVCLVRIHSNGGVATPKRSPAKLSPGSKSMRLTQGYCFVTPPSVARHVSTPDESDADDPSTQEVHTPLTPSTSSLMTPNSGFSFAKGGGGDLLISPSSQASKTSKSARSTPRDLCIIPLQCLLGKRLSALVCYEASFIQLNVSSESKACLNAQRVLERLVLATHADRYIHQDDVLGISFQGRATELKVEKVEGRAPVDELRNYLAALHVTSAPPCDPDESIVQAVRAGLQNEEHQHRIKLYKLCYSTNFVLTFNDAEVKDVTSEHSDSNRVESNGKVVAGLDTTLEQVKELLLPPRTQSDLFRNHSLKPPRGVLLHGPNGVGKSLLAQQIKLDLQSDGVHVESMNCTSLQSHTTIVGEAERRLTRLFRTTGQHDKSGTLLILDDIHLICPKRGGTNQGADRLVATLLALLDGVGTAAEGKDNLVILGITSNASLLDPALRRPGRLDAEIEVPIPDEKTRAEIIQFQLEGLCPDVSIPRFEENDFMALSRLAKGFHGADTMLAIKEALRKAIFRVPSTKEVTASDTISLTLQDFEDAIRMTKPSTISSITVEIPQVHWTSIGGMDTVKQKLRESIELPITHAHLFEALNIPPPRGILLYGPPGCSKTLMARALATEGQMNFLAVKGPELLSKWLGESERALASLFRRARMASPCIIFFDEIDAIASKRSGGGTSGGGERLLSQLLTELDGICSSGYSSGGLFKKKERVIVVGATNRPDLLDSALTRPGRIDQMIYVGLPDESSRSRIFEIGLKEKSCSADIDVPRLASDEISGGFSGAELIAICREAALLAIEESEEERIADAASPQISMRHLSHAINGMQRQITQEMLDFYASYNQT